MFSKPLPRFVIAKRLASGSTAFYFHLPAGYRKLGCPVPNEPLGTDYEVACGENGDGGRAAARNALFDEWNRARKGQPATPGPVDAYGTVDWLFREYKASKAYLEKVAPRSRPDYERTMLLVTGIVTKTGDRIGDRRIRAISPVSADKIYDIICNGPRGPRPRQGEKAIALCRRAWRVVHRLHPNQFDRNVPNPWEGVTKHRRTKGTKAAVTRDQVYAFAWGCIEHGEPEAAAAAVICFEWLQRPENVLSGYLRWPDYRSKDWPSAIKIEHHKTGAVVWHPLEEVTDSGVVRFYEDAEAVLSRLPRRGVPMIKRGEGRYHQALLIRRHAEDRADDACQTRSSFHLYARRLSSRRHDGAGGSRANGRSGTRPLGPQESASLRGICQAHDGTGAVGHAQTSCPSSGERARNEHSEYGPKLICRNVTSTSASEAEANVIAQCEPFRV